MTKFMTFVAGWTLLIIALSACGSSAVTELPVSPMAASTELPVATEQSAVEPETTVEARNLDPQDIEFQSIDGTSLAGIYWPPAQSPAPGIILMHMMGHDKESWGALPALLQGVGIADDAAQQRSYAVLAFDFRGHGESGGDAGDRPGMLDDAKAALAYFQSLPDVDKDRIVLIGASVGADAAVDACSDGCIGAISLSPGSFLGVIYNDALLAMVDKPVLCVASQGDSFSAKTCQGGEQADLGDYQVQIYEGGEHGTDMFEITDQQPMLTDLIFEWLTAHVLGD